MKLAELIGEVKVDILYKALYRRSVNRTSYLNITKVLN